MRKGYWKCSVCGMQSTRRWNVLRHINRQHQGNADTLSSNALAAGAKRYSSIAAQPGVSTSQKLPDPVLAEKYGSRPRIQHVVDRHLYESLKQRMATLPQEPISYRGSICANCLTIDLVPIRPASDRYHYCNPLWLLDYPELTSHKDQLKEYIKTHMPVYLARAIREQNKGRVELLAFEMKDSPLTHPVSFFLTPPPGSDPKLKPLYDMINVDLARHYDPEQDWTKPIRLGSLNENHWASRAIMNRETKLSQNELIEFISMTGGTVGIFNITSKFYLMLIEILGS